MRLALQRIPFDHPEWLYELKLDGFRALAIIERGQCRLVSRNGNVFASFGRLAELLPKELRSREAVLDGEIVCMDRRGRPQFNHLFFRRGIPRFAAFDLLWCDGEDTRYLPLTDRKQRLRQIIRGEATMAMYVHHIDGDGVNLFQEVCRRNLEGIVAKWKFGPYDTEQGPAWMKIKNPRYSQAIGRDKLFEKLQGMALEPWQGCDLLSEAYFRG